MKKIGIWICVLALCLTAVTACGQRPEMPESSIPLADVSDTTTTTEETTTTTEETTTTTTAETTTTTAKPTTTTRKPTTTPTTTTSGTTASTTTTTVSTATTTENNVVPDVIVFNTENVRRVTFYSHYGAVKVRDVPAEDKTEVLNWLGTFRIKERVDGYTRPGTNTYYVEIEYSDGTIIKKGLSAVIVDGELYYITHSADYYYDLDMIFGEKGTSTSTTTTRKTTTFVTTTTTTTTTMSTTRTTASTTTMTVPDVTVFNTENIHRITFYYKYGEEKVRDVPADDKTEVINWLKTFTFEKMVDDLMPPGTNTYYVEIEYLDGTIVKEGLDAVVVDGELYYVEHGADSYYELDMIWGKGGTATFTDP